MIRRTFIDFHFILFIVRCRLEDPCLSYENDDNYCELLIIFERRNKNFS